jgi:hypothetical protein
MVAEKDPGMMRYASWLLVLAVLGCASSAPQSRFNIQALGGKSLWIPTARNSTDFDLRLPGTNPLRSLGEIAGKISPDYRPTVMDSLRDSIKREMEQQKVQARFPEEHDARLSVLPPGQEAAARIAREGGLDGSLFLSEIRRWDADTGGLLRLWVEFKLVRIADGAVLWERRVRKVFLAGRLGNPAEAHNDAVREITKEIF